MESEKLKGNREQVTGIVVQKHSRMSKRPDNKQRFCSLLTVYCLLFFFVLAVNVHAESVRYAVIPEYPRPGEPVTVGVEDTAGVKAAVLLSGGKRLSKAAFFTVPAEGASPSFSAAVLAVPSTVKPGTAIITLEGAWGTVIEIPLEIAEREFASETVHLNEALTGLRTIPDPQKTAEAEHLWAIFNSSGNDTYFFGKFIPPVNSTRRTSVFGGRRVYRYSNGSSDTTIHAGIDYGVPKGTEVRACGSGRVVLARYRIVTGYTVILEHLPGVYSLYYHLDRIIAAEGDTVNIWALLGYSGATGLATGPHLHWEIRVSGENTDPDAFIARPILDKEAILGKINN